MRDDTKIWVIEDDDQPVVTSLGDDITAPARRPAPRPAAKRTAREAPAPRPVAAATPRPAAGRPRPASRPVHSATTLALAYLFGPWGLLLTRRGRAGSGWVAAAAVGTALAAAVGAGWWLVAARGAATGLVPLLAAGSVASVLVLFSVWARSLDLLLTSHRFPGRPWPAWVRRPWAAGLLGLFVPGVAWAFTRWPRRAVLTLWTGWPLAVSVLLLALTPLLWRHRAGFAGYGVGPDVLEYLFLAAGLAVLAAPLVWVAQALAGARATAQVTDRWRAGRGDWAAAALFVVFAVALAAFRPADLARDLGDGADVLHADGYRVLPVHLTALAHRLDPGDPVYALQLAERHAERGERAEAAAVRRALDEAMRPYLGALVREGAWPPAQAPAQVPAHATGSEPGEAPSRAPAEVAAAPAPAPEDADRAAARAVADYFLPGLPLVDLVLGAHAPAAAAGAGPDGSAAGDTTARRPAPPSARDRDLL